MYDICDPLGRVFAIPESSAEDPSAFTAQALQEAVAFYQAQGYVVMRGLLDPALCTRIRAAFEDSVKPFPGSIYRQTTANPERNRFNERGFVMNPVLNIQDLPSSRFSELKQAALSAFTAPGLATCVEALLGESPTLVQTMYFEGNSATWAHQDTYYLDAERIGSMVGAWIALEDIHPGAGRFYVVPRSHLLDAGRNAGGLGYALHHGDYKQAVLRLIDEQGYVFCAPALARGDVLFWNSRTIHGSLATSYPEASRSSLTAHYIPQSQRFLQFQRRIRRLRLKRIQGMQVHCPKDLDRWTNRAILAVETRFPRLFQAAKRAAIAALTR
jgi:phytanoyl-CoA hydroxylase